MNYLLNAYPKSGSSILARKIKNILPVDLATNNSINAAEKENWVICLYEPVIHLANFNNNTLKISVIRNPLDAITINTERHLKGFLGKQIFGNDLKNIDANVLDEKENLSAFDKQFIDHQIHRYNSFLNCLLKNIDNTMCFTNDQVINQTEACLKNILEYSNFNYSDLNDERYSLSYSNNIEFHPFSVKIMEYLKNHPKFKMNYTNTMEVIYSKQANYPVYIAQ